VTACSIQVLLTDVIFELKLSLHFSLRTNYTSFDFLYTLLESYPVEVRPSAVKVLLTRENVESALCYRMLYQAFCKSVVDKEFANFYSLLLIQTGQMDKATVSLLE